MTIEDSTATKIKRLYHAEKWPIGTIAAHLCVHHSVVRRVVEQGDVVKARRGRPSIVAPYIPFIMETFDKYPRLTASRVYHMVRERGYSGAESHFRNIAALYRPHRRAEAYLRLRTLPGEQGQVDWGSFGTVQMGKAKRNLMGFVMVLSYSRKIFLRFFLDARMANFLWAHAAAFDAFIGVPRVLLYDNLKSAVLQREGDAIRFNPEILRFAGHYHYEPRPVEVARGNQKGRVERAIRYIRDSFFAGRQFEGLADLNAQAEAWCQGIAAERRCPEDRAMTVREAFQFEQGHLMALPEQDYPTDERLEVRSGKTPYIRFDRNDYSIPHTHVMKTLTVFANHQRVRITEGTQLLATHPRSYGQGEQIEDTTHIQALVETKRNARQHRTTDQLIKSIPLSQLFLIKAAERGYSLPAILRAFDELLERFTPERIEQAMQQALDRDSPHPNTVQQILERQLENTHRPPPIALTLSPAIRARDVVVRSPSLDAYDQLAEAAE